MEYTGKFGKKYKEWFISQYKAINKPLISDNEAIEKKANKMDLKYSSINRILSCRTMAFDIQLSINNTLCTTFKIMDMKSKESVIYAFVYSEAVSDQPIYKSDIVYKDIMHRFYVAGPSYLSKDGEYRSGFTNFNSINLCRKHFPDIWNDIEEYLAINLYKRGLRLVSETIYPNEEYKKYSLNMDYSILHKHLNVFLYIVAWFKIARRMYFASVEMQINEKYLMLMLKDRKADMAFIKKLMNKYKMDQIDEFREIISTYYSEAVYSKNIDVRIGQKIIPLNLAEVEHPFNIYFKPWKEYLVGQTVSKLVINNISPSFSLTNRWVYLKNTKKGLFDNPVQYDKMERSDIAKNIAYLLLQAQSYTYENPGEERQSLHTQKGSITTWLSNRFQILFDKIQIPIDYSKEDIIMGDAALCILSEYVGRTFSDMLNLCEVSEYYNTYLGDPLNAGIEYFIKFIFDLCYSLYCINTKLGIIHTDLHLSNVTIHHNQPMYLKEISKIQNAQILYVLGNTSEYQFLMQTHGYYASIIDFSRCVIHTDFINKFQDPSLPKIYSVTSDLNKFQTSQIDYLVKAYIHEFPTFQSKKNELKVLFQKRFNSCFKLLTALDIYVFTRKIASTYDVATMPKIHKKGIALMKKINQISETYLTTEMNKLMENSDYYKEIEHQPWPMESIILQCFSKYNVNNAPIGTILDVFNYDNDMKYSIETYENFPPYLKQYPFLNKEDADMTKQELMFKHAEDSTIDHLKYFEKSKKEKMKLVEYISKRHFEKYF